MISAEHVEDYAWSESQIIHLKTGNTYWFIGPCKAKINGEWVDGASYESRLSCSQYWRAYDDFEGFSIYEEY